MLGGRAATARIKSYAIERHMSRLGTAFDRDADQQRNLKCVAKRRGDDLSEGGTECACRFAHTRSDSLSSIATKNMAEFMNDCTLLRRKQQQQEAERFKPVFHTNEIDLWGAARRS